MAAREHGTDLPSYESLLTDYELYNSFIYTDLDTAVQELAARKNDAALAAYVDKVIPGGPPDILRERACGVLFRHMATPNFEAQRFWKLASAVPELHPVILEYSKDMFTNRNGWKFAIAKLCFDKGLNKLREGIVQYQTIIDINAANFKPIRSVETHWGENLFAFHHRFFKECMKDFAGEHVDISDWLASIGPSARDYYKTFLALFLRDGILFEYFLLKGEEEPFTKEIILPSLLDLERESGYKPLIVRLQPRESEGSSYWLSYPFVYKQFLDESAKTPHNTDT